MASVSSLDQDMRKLRMDRYTLAAADEVRSWIEDILGERMPSDDLLEGLKDGVALCKLANLALPPPGVKYKASSMPFTQRENISQFLRACESSPLSLPAHDRFLTVDLYDGKDPAQVIQCLGAFSRAANAANPSRFPIVIGPKRISGTSPTRGSRISPTRSTTDGGVLSESRTAVNRQRGVSNASQDSDSNMATSRALSPSLSTASKSSKSTEYTSNSFGNVSSWSNKTDESRTAPAWNIHQYGYMGGASQGNQGISFGSRRQITSPGVKVPSLAEKERIRKEKEEEATRMRREEEIEMQRAKAERLAQQRREAEVEAAYQKEDTRKAQEKERQEVELEKQRWEAEERRWREEEEQRRREEDEDTSYRDVSELQAQSRSADAQSESMKRKSESERIKELERQLEEAKERERNYLHERGQKEGRASSPGLPESDLSYRRPESVSQGSDSVDNSWVGDEKDYTTSRGGKTSETVVEMPSVQTSQTRSPFQRPLPDPRSNSTGARPLEPPQAEPQPQPPSAASAEPPRPLPDPTKYRSPFANTNRTDNFLANNPAPLPAHPKSHFPAEMGMTSTSERATEDARRIASQTKTKAGGWASKSLLEKEMERERERQKEWEEAQMAKIQNSQGQGGLMGPRELKR